jgi:hypothetical protein
MKTFLAVMLLSCFAFAQDDAAIAKAKAACVVRTMSHSASKPAKEAIPPQPLSRAKPWSMW